MGGVENGHPQQVQEGEDLGVKKREEEEEEKEEEEEEEEEEGGVV